MFPNIIDMYHGDNRGKDINFVALAEYGIWAVIHKATQGQQYTDPKFLDRINAAHSAGLLIAAYHYMDASDPTKQADHFLKTIDGIPDLCVAVDYEKSADGNHPALHQLYDFMGYVDAARRTLMPVYGSDLIRETMVPVKGGHVHPDMLGVMDFMVQHRLWLAEYGPVEKTPQPWSDAGVKPWLWQFKSNGHLPDVVGNVDLNFFDGTKEQLIAEWIDGPDGNHITKNIVSNRGYMGN